MQTCQVDEDRSWEESCVGRSFLVFLGVAGGNRKVTATIHILEGKCAPEGWGILHFSLTACTGFQICRWELASGGFRFLQWNCSKTNPKS